jgi:hypothetical protein
MKRLLLGGFLTFAVIAVMRSVTVSTAGDPALVGQWSNTIEWPSESAAVTTAGIGN